MLGQIPSEHAEFIETDIAKPKPVYNRNNEFYIPRDKLRTTHIHKIRAPIHWARGIRS